MALTLAATAAKIIKDKEIKMVARIG